MTTPTSYESELARTGRIVFTIRGASMRPLFHANEDAIVLEKRAPEDLRNLDIVLFRRLDVDGWKYVLHRIVDRKSDGRWIIAGDNCTEADLVETRDILGVVVSAERRGRPIRLSGARYALYEKLWCRPYRFRFAVLGTRRRVRRFLSRIKRKLLGQPRREDT